MFKTIPQFFVVAIWVMFFTTPVSAQDMSQYYTVQNPDDFTIDWTGFYHRMNAHTARVRDAVSASPGPGLRL